jgi:hypothetical protein
LPPTKEGLVTDDGTQATVVSDDGKETSAPVEISLS